MSNPLDVTVEPDGFEYISGPEDFTGHSRRLRGLSRNTPLSALLDGDYADPAFFAWCVAMNDPYPGGIPSPPDYYDPIMELYVNIWCKSNKMA